MLNYAYQGKEISRDKDQYQYKQTLYGSLSEIDSYIATLTIGTRYQDKGILRSWTKTQKQASLWQVEVVYSISYSSNWSDDDQTVVGKKSAQLSVRNIQIPLQQHPEYRTIWNHYLIANNGNCPSWITDKTDTLLTTADRANYQWVKSIGEVPVDPDSQGRYWEIVAKPSKAGVEYYDMACFVVTISAKYKTASSAGGAISKNINKIASPSQDFGLSGQWKLDQASVSYDGKHWIASSTYTRAIDEWDKDLYS